MEGFQRPKMIVLPESSNVPNENFIRPAPNVFTHEVTRETPYYFGGTKRSKPDGNFPQGTRVTLLRQDGDAFCRVVDGRGLYVEVEFAHLKRLF
jgi:hypothetical protein